MKTTDIFPTPTMNEAPRAGERLITAEDSPFKGVVMTRAIIMAVHLNSVVVAVVYRVLSLNLCGFAHHLL